jgi:hypothetical protein
MKPMKFQYNPLKVYSNHPFRYIDGIIVKSGFNEIPETDYAKLKKTLTFQELIRIEAITFPEEKTPISTIQIVETKEPAKEPEIVTEIVTEEESEIVTELTSPVTNFGELPYKEALSLIREVNDKKILLDYQSQENSKGMRATVLKSLAVKLEEFN